MSTLVLTKRIDEVFVVLVEFDISCKFCAHKDGQQLKKKTNKMDGWMDGETPTPNCSEERPELITEAFPYLNFIYILLLSYLCIHYIPPTIFSSEVHS